jgi:hypothetical protein
LGTVVFAATLSSVSRLVGVAVVLALAAVVLAVVDIVAFSASVVSAFPPQPTRVIPRVNIAVIIAVFVTCILLVLVIVVALS